MFGRMRRFLHRSSKVYVGVMISAEKWSVYLLAALVGLPVILTLLLASTRGVSGRRRQGRRNMSESAQSMIFYGRT